MTRLQTASIPPTRVRLAAKTGPFPDDDDLLVILLDRALAECAAVLGNGRPAKKIELIALPYAVTAKRAQPDRRAIPAPKYADGRGHQNSRQNRRKPARAPRRTASPQFMGYAVPIDCDYGLAVVVRARARRPKARPRQTGEPGADCVRLVRLATIVSRRSRQGPSPRGPTGIPEAGSRKAVMHTSGERDSSVSFSARRTGATDPKPSLANFGSSGRSAQETVVRESGREIPARG